MINLVFVHGLRGNHLGLEELASFFPRDIYNIYIPDLPPAGGNNLAHYDSDHYADFLANYIKSNHIKNPVLIGHSLGSIITAATISRYPEFTADKTVFLSPISAKPARFFAMLTPLTAILPNKLIGYITTKYLFVSHDKKLLKRILKTTYLCGADYTSRADTFRAAKFSAKHAISDFDFKANALFLSGETDRLIPRQKTEETAKKYHAASKYIKNAGHLLNYEAPKTATEIIRDFLEN
ncbi:alpha/beta hydrolase [Candidatus Saccharibacteria bacterium]|nr:alpha/beta hydrolase [Candidatus Saccharibacteria bacterium]